MISIGVHIHQDSICFAGLSLEGSRPKIHFIKEHFFQDLKSEKEKQSLINSELESIEKQYKGESLRFCYGLSQNLVTNFSIDFPFKEKFKILKTLPFEIEDKSPFRSDNVFFDARICKIKNNQSSALCFITPEDNVKEFFKLNSSLKKNPYLLSCEGSALANLLEKWNKPLSQAQNSTAQALYIYLGVQNSQLLFYREGHLEHISVLDWTVAGIVKEMEKLYKLTKQKAWAEFFEKSFILTSAKGWTKEQRLFSDLVKKQIDLLIPKLHLLKMSLETEQKVSIKKAMLFGPGAVIKNLTAFLTAQMSVNVSRLNSIKGLTELKASSGLLAYEAVGLALEGLKSSPYQGLNFLQSKTKESFSLYPKKWRRVGMLLLLGFVVGTAYTFARKKESSKVLDSAQSIFSDFGKKITSMPEQRVNLESIKSFLKKEKEKIASEQIVQDELNQPNPMDYLQFISQKLGSATQWNLSLSYLKLEKGAVEIKGSVAPASLEDFKLKIKSLAKSSFKEHPIPQKPKEVKKDLEPSKQKEKTTKNKKSEPSEDLKKEERAFFSYSFKLKEGVIKQ